jgi:hypothetical protein
LPFTQILRTDSIDGENNNYPTYSDKHMTNIFFYLGLATLLTHEMDAMLNHEWRVLPLTSGFPEEIGMLVFLYAHIPLYAGIIAMIASKKSQLRIWSRIGVSLFLLIHAGLHTFFRSSPTYEFSSTTSLILIYGGGLMGLAHIILELRDKFMGKSK